MVPYHSCYIYGIWRTKVVGKTIKSSFGVTMQTISKVVFMGKRVLIM